MENEVAEKKPKPQIFGMFLSPGEQLDKIRKDPRIWEPLLIVMFLYIVASIVSVMTTKAVLPGFSLEETQNLLADKRVSTIFSGFITPIIGTLISTAIYMIFIKIAQKDTTFKQLFSMNVHISIIAAVGSLLNSIGLAIMGGTIGISMTSLAGLLGSKSPVLATFELFSIWGLIITGMGLHKVGRLSKGVSITIMVIFFLLSLGLAMLSAALLKVAGV